MADKLTKFFRVAVAGATVDGREIVPEWLTQAAASYDPKTYAARVNMEHIRGYSPEKPFCAYGDVVALKAQEVELTLDGKTQKRMGLFAQVAANEFAQECIAKGQKLYPSIEIAPKFAGTDNAYMVGLAMTDTPASIGTEVMKFAAGAGDTKHLFTPSADVDAVVLELETAPTNDEAKSFFAEFRSFMAGLVKKEDPAPKVEQQPATAPTDFTATLAAFGEKLAAGFETAIGSIKTEVASVKTDVTTLRGELEATPAGGLPKREPATGSEAGKFTPVDY